MNIHTGLFLILRMCDYSGHWVGNDKMYICCHVFYVQEYINALLGMIGVRQVPFCNPMNYRFVN